MRNQAETTSEAITTSLCEDCGRPIPVRDIRAYQTEAGRKGILPRCCEDCAEMPEPVRLPRVAPEESGCTCHLLPQTDMDGSSFTGRCRYCEEHEACDHESVTTPDGHGAYCSLCAEVTA